MSLLNKKKKKPLRMTGQGAAGKAGSHSRPYPMDKLPPCRDNCPSGNNIRGWLTVIAQREKSGLDWEAAMDAAWRIEMETTPFPSIMGRVCPHPCEAKCNRGDKDEPVSINAVERAIGDWGIERGLKPPMLDVGGPFDERIAIVGSGPAGLSCAYQLARRGYAVTVFESEPHSGGMLRYGIPAYRLPHEIIDREVQRIADMGVDIQYGVTIGKDITMAELEERFSAVFVGIGAHVGRRLGIPGEEGSGVYTGTEFLHRVSEGAHAELGKRVVVIGGGDTAIDAARMSLRLDREQHQVTILYRRTREEMPAIDNEVEEALEEGVAIEFLASPAEIQRDEDGRVTGMLIQRMQLGEPDESGRRRPVPIEGALETLAIDTVITAVSQSPDMDMLGIFDKASWVTADRWGRTQGKRIWSGGDDVQLGLATAAIGQGRRAAESIHSTLRDVPLPDRDNRVRIGSDRIKLDYYESSPRNHRAHDAADERLAHPTDEVDHGITTAQLEAEVERCFSCGLCFGCERCWMYCTPGCFKKLKATEPGSYYKLDVQACDGCDKCRDECPCGFLEMS